MRIAGRRVEMFRCHIDPQIPPKPRNAFMPNDYGWEAYITEQETGVYVKTDKGIEHYIGMTNIQSIRFMNLPPKEETKKRSGKQELESMAV
jgi:hypothetical protein